MNDIRELEARYLEKFTLQAVESAQLIASKIASASEASVLENTLEAMVTCYKSCDACIFLAEGTKFCELERRSIDEAKMLCIGELSEPTFRACINWGLRDTGSTMIIDESGIVMNKAWKCSKQ